MLQKPGLNERIELYGEILQQDRSSRLFFHLAEMLCASDRKGEAVCVLQKGMLWHPDFFEARLLLVQLLSERNDEIALREEVAKLCTLLEKYPAFWDVWAQYARQEQPRLALPLRLMAVALRHEGMGVEALLERGLADLEGEAASQSTVASIGRQAGPVLRTLPDVQITAPHVSGREGEGEHISVEDTPSLRTRSMANVLAEQGDLVGALAIYQELERRATDMAERGSLQACIQRLEMQMGSNFLPEAVAGPEDTSVAEAEDSPEMEFSDTVELNTFLESLADRLEARAHALGVPVR